MYFRFEPFMWLRPSIHVYTILSFTCLSYCNSSISLRNFLPLVSKLPPISYFLPFVSTPSFRLLSSRSFRYVRLTSFIYTPHSLLYFFPFVSPLTARLLLELFCCNSFLSFVILPSFRLKFKLFPSVRPFLPFQLFPFIRYCLPFVSTLSFHSLLPSFHFNSDIPFVACFPSFQAVHFVTSVLTFHLFYKSNSLLLPLRFTSYSPFVS